MEQCNNYTWVLTAVAEGGKSRDVQGEELGVALYNLLFTGQVKVPCPGEPLLEPQGDPFLSAEELLQEVLPNLIESFLLDFYHRKSQRPGNRRGSLVQEQRMLRKARGVKVQRRRWKK